jgi:hypothetical protein
MKRSVIGMGLLVLLVAGCGGSSTPATTTLGPVTTTGGIPGGFTSGQCASAAQAMAAAAAAVPQAITGAGVDISQSVAQLQAAVDAAPDDIKADLQVVSDGYAQFAQVLADANIQPGQIPPAAVLQQLTQAASSLNTDAFKAAVDRVGTWFRDECGK